MSSDLKYALRQLLKNRSFTIFVVLTLALGIGANTAIFTALNAVLLSTLPVKDPQQLAFLTDPNEHGNATGIQSGVRTVLSYPEFQDLRDHNDVFSGLLAVNTWSLSVAAAMEGAPRSGSSEQLPISMVSGNYFSVLGVNAVLGRTFTAEVDKVRDANPVAVISYRYWQDRLGGDSAVLGEKIRLQDTMYVIIGVAPRSFAGETVGQSPAVWVPLTMQKEILSDYDLLAPEKNAAFKWMCWQVIGRLKPGVSIAQAQASINVLFMQRLRSQMGTGVPKGLYKELLSQRIVLTKGTHGASALRKGYGEPLVILMTLVGLLLLLASANVANLLLARAAFRQREIAVRIALGARPVRIFRQLLTESVLLSFAGGAVGLVLAQWGDWALLRLVGKNLDLHPDFPVLIFTFGVSIIVGIAFGTAPALQAARLDLNDILKGTAGATTRGRRVSPGKILVMAQVSLSLLLMTVAGLFVHSLRKLATADVGYDRDHILIIGFYPTLSGYRNAAIPQLYRSLSDRIREVPGVLGVTYSQDSPLGFNWQDDMISIQGYTPTPSEDMNFRFNRVGPDYFSALGVPILIGRELGPRDEEESAPQYAVINQTMARAYFGRTNPIGRRIRDASTLAGPVETVVGVVADAKYNNVREKTPPFFYVPFNGKFGREPTDSAVEIRTTGNPLTLTAAIRAAVKEVAPNLPPVSILTINQRVDRTLGRDRLLTTLSSFFGALAAVLASIGIYGIMSYSVVRRTRDIGIRMALGARHGNVIWLILSESLLLVFIGTAVGIPAALGVEKLIASLLFGLAPVDALVLASAIAAMFVIAAVAGCIPAWRATRVDPLTALRQE